MTDNEIIKANSLIEKIEDACNAYYDTSRGMPYDIDMTLKESKFFIENALNLINRQKAEIDNLKIELQAMRNAANGYKAEVERLTEENKIVSVYIGNGWGYVSFLEFVKNQRAEAVKEFADTLHDEVFIMSRTPAGDIDFNDFEVVLRKVQKEMVGDE